MHEEGTGISGVFVYAADVFLALAALMILCTAALELSTDAATDVPKLEDAIAASTAISGRKPTLLVATMEGLVLEGQGGVLVPLANLHGSTVLQDYIAQTAGTEQPLMLVIEPDGHEAAFLFMSEASRLGIPSIHQLRLEDACISTVARTEPCRAWRDLGANR